MFFIQRSIWSRKYWVRYGPECPVGPEGPYVAVGQFPLEQSQKLALSLKPTLKHPQHPQSKLSTEKSFFLRYCRSVECRSIGADPHFPLLPRPPMLSAPVSVDTTTVLIILFIVDKIRISIVLFLNLVLSPKLVPYVELFLGVQWSIYESSRLYESRYESSSPQELLVDLASNIRVARHGRQPLSRPAHTTSPLFNSRQSALSSL